MYLRGFRGLGDCTPSYTSRNIDPATCSQSGGVPVQTPDGYTTSVYDSTQQVQKYRWDCHYNGVCSQVAPTQPINIVNNNSNSSTNTNVNPITTTVSPTISPSMVQAQQSPVVSQNLSPSQTSVQTQVPVQVSSQRTTQRVAPTYPPAPPPISQTPAPASAHPSGSGAVSRVLFSSNMTDADLQKIASGPDAQFAMQAQQELNKRAAQATLTAAAQATQIAVSQPVPIPSQLTPIHVDNTTNADVVAMLKQQQDAARQALLRQQEDAAAAAAREEQNRQAQNAVMISAAQSIAKSVQDAQNQTSPEPQQIVQYTPAADQSGDLPVAEAAAQSAPTESKTMVYLTLASVVIGALALTAPSKGS